MSAGLLVVDAVFSCLLCLVHALAYKPMNQIEYALPQILVRIFDFFKKIDSKHLVFLIFRVVLDGLESSGRPVGTISTNFRQNPSGGFRAMTQNPPKCTTINTTTIKV